MLESLAMGSFNRTELIFFMSGIIFLRNLQKSEFDEKLGGCLIVFNLVLLVVVVFVTYGRFTT